VYAVSAASTGQQGTVSGTPGGTGAGNGAAPGSTLSCTRTVNTTSALTGAVASAVGGDTICMQSGSYGAMTWTGGASRTTQVTVEPAQNANVTFTGGLTENASWVDLKNVNMGDQSWAINGPTHNVTMEGITAKTFFITSKPTGGAANITVHGGSYGPNHAYPVNTIGSDATANVNTNITIDAVLFHDQYRDSAHASDHFECLQVWSANGVTIENSRFTNCDVFDIFVERCDPTDCGTGTTPPTPINITIQNNWLDCCTTAASGNISFYKNYAIMFATNDGEGTWANVMVRNNSGDDKINLGTVKSDPQIWTNFRVENNALPRIDDWQDTNSDAVPNGVTVAYNEWFQGAPVGPHDLGAVDPTTIFENWDGGANVDGSQSFEERTNAPTVVKGDPNFYPPTDIDGNARISPPDIGASQVPHGSG
jgi:hypothetical protein